MYSNSEKNCFICFIHSNFDLTILATKLANQRHGKHLTIKSYSNISNMHEEIISYYHSTIHCSWHGRFFALAVAIIVFASLFKWRSCYIMFGSIFSTLCQWIVNSQFTTEEQSDAQILSGGGHEYHADDGRRKKFIFWYFQDKTFIF